MRVLLAIGCNVYDHAPDLRGAEVDARRVFEALIREDIGDYDAKVSCLLLSPTLEDVRRALGEALTSHGQVDTFTFYFAGHGAVRAGSFYMSLRDTRPEGQAFTALALADLLRMLNEAAPAQSHLVIDACEGGGLIADLDVVLKSGLKGDAGTPGVTLLAMAAQNQAAAGTPEGGLGTQTLLDCIEGREFIQDQAEALDLSEIGRKVSERMRPFGQNPVIWGLNLFSTPRFCRNPAFGSDPSKPLRDISQAAPAVMWSHYDALWTAYASVDDAWTPRAFADVVDGVLSALADRPDDVAAFVDRFAVAVCERAERARDAFRPAEVLATLGVCLLPYLDEIAISEAARRLVARCGDASLDAGRLLAKELAEDPDALLSRDGGGLADLFYLPLRVTRVLAWLGTTSDAFAMGDSRRAQADALFEETLEAVLEHYVCAVTTMSDGQAPAWLLAVSKAMELGLTAQAETLVCLAFNAFVAVKGQLARSDIPPGDVLAYLLARQAGDFSGADEFVERPGETLAVLLRLAARLDLGEVLDPLLWAIDGTATAVYAPLDFSRFGMDMMANGSNLQWGVGYDVFRTGDVAASWPELPVPEGRLQEVLAAFASLLYPDRVAWFRLPLQVPSPASR
ncbi:caspase family protein [Brevundimonas sp.]|uniref:caspase family protein n=1 Tax=Brevundimonas sp. TaxID=1871086 RepID=UPI0028AA28BA|nr:caspase family protein [Brevundimonas sp.]